MKIILIVTTFSNTNQIIKMSILPSEIILIIFNYIQKITDKRQFLRTCKLYNDLTKDLIKLSETKFFADFNNNGRYIKSSTYCYFQAIKFGKIKKSDRMKFTLEICSDEYFHLLPPLYLSSKNKVIVGFLAENNKLDMLKLAHKNGCELPNSICEIAMKHGYLDMFKWAIKNNCKWNGSNFGLAAQNNYIHIIEYVIKYIKKYNWMLENPTHVCSCATLSGNLHLVKLIVRNGFRYYSTTCASAAGAGHLHILKWLRKYNCSWDAETCSKAAENGHLDILKWARENGCNWDVITCGRAAGNGHLDILKWARENGCDWDYRTCSGAAKNGHLDVLKWARQNGCSWNMNTTKEAAKEGHFHILHWAITNGCEWDSKIWSKAAKYGKIDLLKWAVKNGFSFDYQVCEKAAINSHYNIVRWILENGYEIGDETCCHIAYDINEIELLKLLMNKGGIWGDRVQSLVAAKNMYDYGDYHPDKTLNNCKTKEEILKLLKWARKHGYPV